MNEMLDRIVQSEYEDEKGISIVLFNGETKLIRLVFVKPNVR